MTTRKAEYIQIYRTGDLNKDGFVDQDDFKMLARNYGQTVDSAFTGDIDGDGIVGFSDFLLLSKNFD